MNDKPKKNSGCRARVGQNTLRVFTNSFSRNYKPSQHTEIAS